MSVVRAGRTAIVPGVPLSELTILGRIGLALMLGLLLGLEREAKGHEAGLRTHILVCIGACLFTLAGTFGLPVEGIRPYAPVLRSDVSRVASQIVVGIGFLGGGTILQQRNTVRGLTTAANLWVAAAIGLSCALGFYLGAVVVTVIVIACLLFLKPLEVWIAALGRRARGGPPPDADV